jgi:hypothetical protein
VRKFSHPSRNRQAAAAFAGMAFSHGLEAADGQGRSGVLKHTVLQAQDCIFKKESDLASEERCDRVDQGENSEHPG